MKKSNHDSPLILGNKPRIYQKFENSEKKNLKFTTFIRLKNSAFKYQKRNENMNQQNIQQEKVEFNKKTINEKTN